MGSTTSRLGMTAQVRKAGEDGDRRELALAPGRHAWVHVARGTVDLNGESLAEGDGAAVSGPGAVRLAGKGPAEVLVFDLA
jgi:quercetin 2,3-dioxygenase